MTGNEGGAEPVLTEVDRAYIIAIPLLVLTVITGLPAMAVTWVVIGAICLALTLGMAILGRLGRAPWRGVVYTIVTLVPALGALWSLGPITGTGVMIGVAVLFAAAFLPRLWLGVVVVLSAAVIVVRAGVGEDLAGDRLEVPSSLWVSTAFASALLLWIVMRVLSALVASLEHSYTSAAAAYERATVTRRQLDASRQELDELAQVEMVGRLAGGVAHDVNNALAAVFASFEELAIGASTANQRRHVAELEAASQHAADLVRDLLWIGRKFPVSSTSVADLVTTVRACLERVSRVAPTLAIDLELEHTVQLAVSPEHLEQILFGLVVGAHRAGVTRLGVSTQLTTELEISMRAKHTDTSPAARSRAMKVQLSVSAARQLVGQSGGSLTVSDPGANLAVTVRLPLASMDRDTQPHPLGRLRTALVIEDEPMVLRQLCQLVARRGYEVTGASTMAEGLALLATNPDLLITDLQLPDGSGEDIAIASFEATPGRPIIVCSGFSASDLHGERLRVAPITFLAKPFTTADLEAALPDPTKR